MKLRSIELTDIRRFAGRTVRLGPIGDGVSVLAAPNESGKSTLFDALQAVFFRPHTGKSAEVRSLQPLGGGAPRAAVEIELDGALWRIEKRWLSAPQARILAADGTLIAQADQAEAWIEARLGAPLGGPSGLLWVRQGKAEFDRKDDPAARRDILGQVAGEIDAMTGGRRMDLVLARVAEALEVLVTASGRPRAGGPWKAALDEVEALAAREAELADRARILAEALAQRREAERRRRELDDPAAAADRAERLRRAEAAAEAARRHAERQERLADARRLAEITRDGARACRDTLRARADERDQAARARAEAEAALAEADRRAAGLRARAEGLRRAADGARTALDAARARHAAALAARQSREAAARAEELAKALAGAEAALRQAAEAEAARAAIPVTLERLDAARAAEARLARLTAAAEARAVTLRFAYDGPARALRDGVPVEAVQRLTGPATYDLPGLGRLTVEPGLAGSDDPAPALAEARAARDRALAACGAPDLPQAEAALARADELSRTACTARQIAAALAPDGIEALHRALAEAQVRAAGPDAAPPEDPDLLAEALAAAERAAAAAEAEARPAEAEAARAQSECSAAAARLQAAAERLAKAEAVHGPDPDHAAALAAADAELAAALARLDELRVEAEALARDAPDPQTVAALLARARGEAQAHRAEADALDRRLAELKGQIGALAEQGIEETLAEVRDRLAHARARAAAHADEVAALQRLRAALEAARSAARTAYLAPVVQELVPLLSLLHPGAGVSLDDATLLPAALERGGRAEGLEILSGGTREQIAVLTRLAFARLFARAGRPVPVILDDALVQTDDARIEAMFTALHRAARGQQVIVLTCRQRAFAALGGQRLELQPLG